MMGFMDVISHKDDSKRFHCVELSLLHRIKMSNIPLIFLSPQLLIHVCFGCFDPAGQRGSLDNISTYSRFTSSRGEGQAVPAFLSDAELQFLDSAD